jgi:Fe-S cluster assembly protein SufB
MEEPDWAYLNIPAINYQNIQYYSIPKTKKKLGSLDDVDPELLRTFEKLGVSLNEQKLLANVAVDAVFDSVSIGTTFKKQLQKAGVIFCSITEAVESYPDLIEKYIGSVVPIGDNFFSALNSAVFSDGSFCYIPKNIKCPLELSTYFRINNEEAGQFERTLIIAEENSSVNYLEGCTAPQFSTNQLHAAVVELIALENLTEESSSWSLLARLTGSSLNKAIGTFLMLVREFSGMSLLASWGTSFILSAGAAMLSRVLVVSSPESYSAVN